MCDRQRQAHQVARRRPVRPCSDGVQLRGVRGGDPERTRLTPFDARDAGVVPAAHMVTLLHRVGPQVQPGADVEVQHRRRVGQVLAEDQHGVGVVDVGRRPQPQARVGGHLQHGGDEAIVGVGHSAEEVVGPHESAQSVVGLQGRPRRAYADRVAAAQQSSRRVEGEIRGRCARSGTARYLCLGREQPRRRPRRPHPRLGVDELETEPAAVAEEHPVDVAVEAREHAAHLAVARRRVGVAAEATVGAHRRCALQIPFARVPVRERLVVEHARGADLDEVAAELTLERTALVASEVDLVTQAEHAEVATAGIVVVEARAPVAGDAAVELMGHEGSQILVLEGPLAAPVAPVAVAGHHRHVLQVALAALVAHRAVVGVAEHHELDHLGAEAHGLRVVDVDPGALLRLRHAGHGDLAPRVALTIRPVQPHRALAAGADGAHRGVPAEEGEVEPE